jgi:hypothetical protein
MTVTPTPGDLAPVPRPRVRARARPQDMPTWKVVTDVIVPATRERQCRYVEMLTPGHVGPCNYFISHRCVRLSC